MPTAARNKQTHSEDMSKIDGRSLRQKTGKCSNDDYTRALFYIKKSTKKSMTKILAEQEAIGDSSDLVEKLLQAWIAEQKA